LVAQRGWGGGRAVFLNEILYHHTA
jgi:hypothetical protein